MEIEFEKEKSVLTVFLNGDIDHHSAKEMREEIDFEIEKKNPQILVMNFSRVTFTDSSGIGLVMGRYRIMRMKGGKTLAVGMSSQIKKIFTLSGLAKLGVIEEEII